MQVTLTRNDWDELEKEFYQLGETVDIQMNILREITSSKWMLFLDIFRRRWSKANNLADKCIQRQGEIITILIDDQEKRKANIAEVEEYLRSLQEKNGQGEL